MKTSNLKLSVAILAFGCVTSFMIIISACYLCMVFSHHNIEKTVLAGVTTGFNYNFSSSDILNGEKIAVTALFIFAFIGIVTSIFIFFVIEKNISLFKESFNGRARPDDFDKSFYFREFKEIAGIVSDKSGENRELLTKLQYSKEWLENVFNSLNSGLCVADCSNDTVLEVNSTACEMFGLSRKEIVNQKYQNFFDGSELDMDLCLESMESFIHDSKGEKIPVFLACNKVKIVDREYLILNFMDISEKKNLEKSIRHSQKMEAIGTLAGGIAHEFNNILGIMIGYCDLAFDKVNGDASLEKYLQEIEKAGMRAKDIILQLLSFSRGRENEIKTINIAPVLKETAKLLKSSIPSHIDFKFRLGKNLHKIKADPAQLYEIIVNLCTNAYQAMDISGGVLSIDIKNCSSSGEDLFTGKQLPAGEYIKIIVTDTGEGIPEHLMSKIFEPYFTTKGLNRDNSGMGLSVVHGIVELNGGFIDVRNRTDSNGLAVSIFFPASDCEASDEKGFASTKGNETIFFVDDEPAFGNIARVFLEDRGYNVIFKNDSNEAFSFFKDNHEKIDLVITDMAMPGIRGTDLVFKIKEISKEMKILISSGFQIDQSAGFRFNTSESFIMKPYKLSELNSRIRKILDAS